MKELKNKKAGLVSGFIAYFWWGFLALFFKYVDQVPSMEVFAHRVFWAVPFGAAILLLRKDFTEVKKAFLNTKILFYLTLFLRILGEFGPGTPYHGPVPVSLSKSVFFCRSRIFL